jgi:hypothetical protein
MIMISGGKWVMMVGVGMMFSLTSKIWKIAMKEKINFMVQVENGR